VTWDDELEQNFIPILESDRPAPTGPPPPAEIVEAVWALVTENPRLLGRSGRLYDEIRELGLTATRSQIILAMQV
jgi:hypothetical protein